MITALGIAAVLLAVAAVAQAIRIGIRQGDWTPLLIGVGLVVALGGFYLLALSVAPNAE